MVYGTMNSTLHSDMDYLIDFLVISVKLWYNKINEKKKGDCLC